jgi:phage shock protein PspC (stress-responsive transcriptional regulator)/FtsH-binding integral membrane protein
MTTTETVHMTPPPPTRKLRRSRTDRIGAGVAGGLGEYFRVDPVIFRVLFATAAFFGGAGVLGYLLAWAAIPEAGTERAPIDGWVAALRTRRVPVWAIAVAAGLLLWLIAFSWWAPGPFFPLIAVVIVLVVVFGRRVRPDVAAPAPAPVSLTKADAAVAEPAAPGWPEESRRWFDESRTARRRRIRRAFPVKIATLLTLAAVLLTLGLIDAAKGIALPVYFWCSLAILGGGLLVGMVLRRTPWSLVILLVPAVIGTIAFAGSKAQLHDGVGQREWLPVSAPDTHYALAVGDATLDLRSLQPQSGPETVRIDQGAGRLRIIAPTTLAMRVVTNVHFGVITVDGEPPRDGVTGVGLSRTVDPLPTATGPLVTVDVHLADGRVDIVRR